MSKTSPLTLINVNGRFWTSCLVTLYCQQALAANGVAVVGPEFINNYLVSETRLNVEDCLVKEFKPFWNARR